MRSIWKGSISFGLVSIAVKLYSATEEKDVSFHQVHRLDAGRIRYRRVCSVCGEEVAYNDIAKGFELPDGDVIVLTDDDLAELPLTSSREIDVLQFVPLEQVDPIYFNRSYYLEPDPKATKPYVLLRDALVESGRVAIVKVALRQREALATLRVRDEVLTLETMLWPDEVREVSFPFLGESVEIRKQELAMANSLVESLSGDFDPSQYTDRYREALDSVIEAKIEGRDLVPAPDTGQGAPGTVVDLMAALQASVDAARRGRAANATEAEQTEKTGKTAKTGKTENLAPVRRARTPAKAAAKTTSAATTATRAAKAPAKTPASTASKTATRTTTRTAAKAPAKKAVARTRRSA